MSCFMRGCVANKTKAVVAIMRLHAAVQVQVEGMSKNFKLSFAVLYQRLFLSAYCPPSAIACTSNTKPARQK